ncbi:MAG: DUF302 domain-containing protein [Chromatiaceae bacterium]|nr:DUF302 domain-containing protein [Gammaproteobacteria bacterium]MCP5300446.1 DUF302 domain-containing protein [Chromatiaceae bacterium]MCP5422518.1 DUF302 domain-containing protein [Chromatiaceae bacterium]
MTRYLIALALLIATGSVAAAPPGVLRLDAKAPMDVTYRAVHGALEEARFWVVFEVDLGGNLASFAERWGEDYNRNALSGIRSVVVCNGWYANQVGNADPDLLALCPLRVNLVEKDGVTRILFARPTVIAQGSPAIGVVKEIEDAIKAALEAAVATAEGR